MAREGTGASLRPATLREARRPWSAKLRLDRRADGALPLNPDVHRPPSCSLTAPASDTETLAWSGMNFCGNSHSRVSMPQVRENARVPASLAVTRSWRRATWGEVEGLRRWPRATRHRRRIWGCETAFVAARGLRRSAREDVRFRTSGLAPLGQDRLILPLRPSSVGR